MTLSDPRTRERPTVATQSTWVRWLIVGWLIAATCDIGYATGFSYLRSGVPPTRVLHFVASGALGPDAYTGGIVTAAIGLGFHYLIALIFTATFFAAARAMRWLVRRPIVVGPLYGIAIYLIMNDVVIPLSRIGPRPRSAAIVVITGVLVHMFLIGTPIALTARRAFGRSAGDYR
jgi:hypothetical protein